MAGNTADCVVNMVSRANNGVCEDGGLGFDGFPTASICAWGTDLGDCPCRETAGRRLTEAPAYASDCTHEELQAFPDVTRAQCEAIALAESGDAFESFENAHGAAPDAGVVCMQLKVAGKDGQWTGGWRAEELAHPANRAFTCGRPESERCHCHAAAASLGLYVGLGRVELWTSDDAAFHGDRLDAREIGVRGPSGRTVFQLAPGAARRFLTLRGFLEGAPLRLNSLRAFGRRDSDDASARRLSEDAASERGDEEPDPPPSKSTHSNSSPLEPSPSSLELAPDPESSSKEASRAAGAEMPDEVPDELPADCADSRALNYNPTANATAPGACTLRWSISTVAILGPLVGCVLRAEGGSSTTTDETGAAALAMPANGAVRLERGCADACTGVALRGLEALSTSADAVALTPLSTVALEIRTAHNLSRADAQARVRGARRAARRARVRRGERARRAAAPRRDLALWRRGERLGVARVAARAAGARAPIGRCGRRAALRGSRALRARPLPRVRGGRRQHARSAYTLRCARRQRARPPRAKRSTCASPPSRMRCSQTPRLRSAPIPQAPWRT